MREAWRGLPPVELVSPAEPPDAWYLPAIEGRLNLPLATPRQMRVDVVVNLPASERGAGSLTVQDRSLSALLPSLKALLQMGPGKVSFRVALLDLSRQQVVFRQDDGHPLDWSSLRTRLAAAEPGKIDVKSLQDRRRRAAFFVDEVARRLRAAPDQAPDALIVLSSAMDFEGGQDLHPIQLPAGTACRVFYFRFATERTRLVPTTEWPRREHSRRPMSGTVVIAPRPEFDKLAGTLKPLRPRLFNVRTPGQVRKGIAVVLAGLAGK